MTLKSSDSLFKRAAPAGSAILMAAVLAACGGGPIDNSHLSEMPPQKNLPEQNTNDKLALNPPSDTGNAGGANAGGEDLRTLEEWRAEDRKPPKMSKEEWEEYEKQRKAHENDVREDWDKFLQLATSDDNDESDHDGNLKFVVVGLDSQVLKSESADRPETYVSLSGDYVAKYFRQNCPVREGLDLGVLDAHGLKRLYGCMAGVYVGRNEKGGMCYTFINRRGDVRHVNDNVVVDKFSAGVTDNPYPWYQRDKSIDASLMKIQASEPLFTRVDVGQNMFMIVNLIRRYWNPEGVLQKIDGLQEFRYQQAVFKFNLEQGSEANFIHIYQKNTDEFFGTGGLEDTCYVPIRGGQVPLTAPEEGKDSGGKTSNP